MGARTTDARNSRAVVREVRPVRPPAAMPEADSTVVVTVEVPTRATAAVEMASAIRASFMRMALPSLSTMPACFAAPSRVPMESNILTREKLMTSMTTVRMVWPRPPLEVSNIPAKSSLNRETSAKSLKDWPMLKFISPIWVTPMGMPMMVVTTMPITTAPLTFLATRKPMTARPMMHRIAFIMPSISPPPLQAVKSTRETKVDSLATTTPPLFRPRMVINRPIPGVIAALTESGIALTIASRMPTAEMTMNRMPEMNTITRASW